MAARSILLALLLALLSAGPALAQNPGEPVTVVATGFNWPCRLAVDNHGVLYVNDFPEPAVIYKIAADGTKTVFNEGLPTPRGITFDAFDNMLVAGRDVDTVYRIASDGTVTPFFEVFSPRGIRTGPNGDIWVASVGKVHHFDAMGRLLEVIDVGSQGATAFDVQFCPNHHAYIGQSATVWRLEGTTVIPLRTGALPRNGSPHFDMVGNAYWYHSTLTEDDSPRVVYADSNLDPIDEHFADLEAEPCYLVFGRDASGAGTRELFVGLTNGTVVKLNSDGISAPGVPEVGLTLAQISEEATGDCFLNTACEIPTEQSHFLDVIGNNNGGYDLGDFRAFLIARGIIDTEAGS